MFAVYLVPFFPAAFSLGPQPEEYTSPVLSGTLIGGGAEGWAGHEGRTKAREKGAEIREESGPIYRNAKTMIGIMCVSFLFGTS
jgi:hypothetical protein